MFDDVDANDANDDVDDDTSKIWKSREADCLCTEAGTPFQGTSRPPSCQKYWARHFELQDGSDDDDSNNEDEGDNNLEKVMVEKADLADGLLLELEEERSRSHNR